MANYCCTIRTNYFHVKDAEEFRRFMSHVQGNEDSVNLWEETDDAGKLVFGFGVYGSIIGYVEDEDEDYDSDNAYDAFIAGLQQHVSENDAIIIFEAGNEKKCYVVGSALVITSSATEYLDIRKLAVEKAAELLKNPTYTTQTEY